MAAPLTNFQEPGFFSEIKESPSLFLLPGSVRVVGLIGTGKATATELQEEATRVDTGTNHVETLDNSISSITRVFSTAVFQYPTSSYSTSITGTVAAGAGYNVSSETFKITVGGGSEVTVTFTGTDPISISSVVTQLNTGLGTQATAESVGDKVRIVSGVPTTAGDGGKKLKIGAGTANSDLGFTDSQVGKEINWKASFASTDSAVRPLDAEKYFVDYERPKVAADLKPKSFFSLSQVSAEYGDPSTSNQLSLGAQAAFANGASIVTARQLDPDTGATSSEVSAALKDMEAERIDILVPMVTDTTFWSKYLTHVSKMSSKLERRERRAIISVDETVARIAITGSGSWTTLMATFTSGSGLEPKRVMVVNPGRAKVTVKSSQIVTNGTYSAAALAGAMASPAVDTATPMTRKALASIDELLLPDLLRSEKNTLTSLGVTVLEHSGALVVVRRAVTADSTSIAAQEPSIVFALDQVAGEMRQALETRFVGTKIGNGTKAEVEAAANTFLDRFVASEIISAFRNVKAEKNTVEPRQFDLSAEVLPIFPFLWGRLDLSIVIS